MLFELGLSYAKIVGCCQFSYVYLTHISFDDLDFFPSSFGKLSLHWLIIFIMRSVATIAVELRMFWILRLRQENRSLNFDWSDVLGTLWTIVRFLLRPHTALIDSYPGLILQDLFGDSAVIGDENRVMFGHMNKFVSIEDSHCVRCSFWKYFTFSLSK